MSQEAFEYLCKNADKLPPELPEVHLTPFFVTPTARNEFVFIGPRECGKSTWLRQLGSGISGIDGYDCDTEPDLHKVALKLHAMKRAHDERARSAHVPIAVIRDTTWYRVRDRVQFSIDATRTAAIKFPVAAFYAALAKLPVAYEALCEVFSPTFLDIATDTQGRLLPKLAYEMILATLKESHRTVQNAKSHGGAAAASAWLMKQPDLMRWLVWLAPADVKLYDRRHQQLRMRKEVARSRLKSNIARGERPWGLTVAEYMDYLEESGVWKLTHRGFYQWGAPYSIGAAFCKSNLTKEALQAKLGT